MEHLGRHWLVEMYGCRNLKRCETDGLDAMRQAAELAGATIVGYSGHNFEPEGFSAVILVAESHLSIHTWPEQDYAAIDIFTCGESIHPEPALAFLRGYLGARDCECQEIRRGSAQKTGKSNESLCNERSQVGAATRPAV